MSFKGKTKYLIRIFAYAGIVTCILSTAAFAEWNQFRGNAGLTGAVTTTTGPNELNLIWRASIESSSPTSPSMFTSPVADSDGNVYLSIFPDSTHATLRALDSTTGSKLWDYTFDRNLSSLMYFDAPLLVNDTVYVVGSTVGSGNSDLLLQLIGVNRQTGLLTDAVTLPKNFANLSDVVPFPLSYANGTILLYVTYKNRACESLGSLFAINRGTVAWKIDLTLDSGIPIVIGNLVYVAVDGEIHAYNLNNGEDLGSCLFYPDHPIYCILANPSNSSSGTTLMHVFTSDNYYYRVLATYSANSTVTYTLVADGSNATITNLNYKFIGIPMVDSKDNAYYPAQKSVGGTQMCDILTITNGTVINENVFAMTTPWQTIIGDKNDIQYYSSEHSLYSSTGRYYSYDDSYFMNFSTTLGGEKSVMVVGVAYNLSADGNSSSAVSEILKIGDAAPEPVPAPNTAPKIIAAPTAIEVEEDNPINATIVAMDAEKDILTCTAEVISGPTTDLLFSITNVFAESGTYKWEIGNAGAEPGIYEVVFKVSDGDLTDQTTVTLIVTEKNLPPNFVDIETKTTTVGATVTFKVEATDPNGDTLIYKDENLPEGATFVDQVFSWTPTTVGVEQASFSVTDGELTDYLSVVICVIAAPTVTHDPVLAAISDQTVVEGQSITPITISASDADGDQVTLSLPYLPEGATFEQASGQNYGTLSWTTQSGQAGTYTLKVYATDGNDGEATDSFVITVMSTPNQEDKNQPPVMSSIPDATIYAGDTFSTTVSGTDPEEGFLTFSCNGLPTGATFDDNTIAWTPTEDQVGEYTITVTAQDDHGNFGRTDFTIKVLPKPDASDPNTTENHAPNFESVDPITADVGELVSFQISASDEDGDTLTYSQYLSAGWGEFDATTRTFSGTPTSAGTYNMIFKVTDGTASDYLGVSVTVNAQTTDPEPTPPAASLDATAPETTILISGTQGDQNWYTSAVMTFSTNEDATTIYRLNNGSLTVYEGAVTLPDGDYTISYYSVDTSGNIETAKSATAKCDGSGPTLQIYKNSEELAADADICATWGESLNIAPQVADPTSGINKLEITFDDLQVTQVLASDLTLDLSGSVVTSYVTDGETIYSMNLSQSIATSSCSLNDTVTLKVTATDNAGNVSEYSADVSFKAAGGDVINYPNPVNPISENENFNFTLEQDSTVKIVVYNISGKNVWTYTGQHAAGSTTITWNCVDNFGSRLGSGLYVYRVIVNNQLYGKGKILSIAK